MFGQDIVAEAARELINKENGVLLDIRTKEEYDIRHIEGCLFIPLNQLGFEVEQVIEEYDTPIILYCRSGQRTKIAAMVLHEMGYTRIYDLGSIDNWN